MGDEVFGSVGFHKGENDQTTERDYTDEMDGVEGKGHNKTSRGDKQGDSAIGDGESEEGAKRRIL
jgi:hypothetical protein